MDQTKKIQIKITDKINRRKIKKKILEGKRIKDNNEMKNLIGINIRHKIKIMKIEVRQNQLRMVGGENRKIKAIIEEIKEIKEIKEMKKIKEIKEIKENKEIKEVKEIKEIKGIKEIKDL